MRWIAAMLVAAVSLSVRAGAAEAGPTVTVALPPHARLLSERHIAGIADLDAVAYTAAKPEIGVVALEKGTYRLLWSRELPYLATLVTIPGSGLFGGISTASEGKAGAFFVYRFQKGEVQPAIESHPHGIVETDDGVRFSAGEFVAVRSDVAHAGSVAYILVTHFALKGDAYRPVSTVRRPDYPGDQLPAPRALVKTARGDTILLRLRVAVTEQERETGLMNVKQMDPDSGMIFVWDQPVLESFWMENTYIPLTVAFLSPNGTIQEMQDMQPLTTEYHTPLLPYEYAIEANLGFFARNDIQVGDRLELDLAGG